MPTTTTRLGIPKPLASESPNGPAQIGAVADALDNAAIDLAEGTLAARPAPAIRGRWYYANDVAILYRDSGSTWRSLQQMLGTDVLTAANLAPDSVGNSELAPLAVTNAEVAAAAAIAESKLALASDAAAGTASRRTLGSGALQAMAGNATPTPADASVTVAKTGTGDNGLARGAFSARLTADTRYPAGTGTVMVFTAEDFDVSGWYNTATGRYTPQVAGYYHLSAFILPAEINLDQQYTNLFLRKNGSQIKGLNWTSPNGANISSLAGEARVSANGTTDYFEIFIATAVPNPGVLITGTGVWAARFEGELIGRS